MEKFVQEIAGKDFSKEKYGENEEDLVYKIDGKAFLVVRPKTVEVRCDEKLSKLLQEKYETVMESRYFGRGGIEIVPAGQLNENEMKDLVRLSFAMTKKIVAEG